MRIQVLCKICEQELSSPDAEHTRKHLLEMAEKIREADPMQYYTMSFVAEWV